MKTSIAVILGISAFLIVNRSAHGFDPWLAVLTVFWTTILVGPICLVFMLIPKAAQGVREAKVAYRDARTEGMTPAQLHTYHNDVGFIGRHYKAVAVVALIGLAILVPYMSAPLFIIYCARAWMATRKMKEEVDTNARSSIRS
jgi:hypothetical protein